MSAESVTAYFKADHDRLDELFARFQRLKRTDFPLAAEAFKAFQAGLRRHIIWEEELLFPLFERKTGMTSGPTQVMRMEHRQIGRDLDAIHGKVEAQQANTVAEEQSLQGVLSRHNFKEEKILYPAIDQALQDNDRASLFDAMSRIPEPAHATHTREGGPSGG